MKVPKEILQILEKCRVENMSVFLPERLERKVYEQVNKILENIGGKWNRRATCHRFDYDPTEAFENLLLTGETEDMKKIFQFFPTPRAVGERLCDMAELTENSRVLEPSVGKGDLADVIWEQSKKQGNTIEIYGVELNKDMGRYLADKPYKTVTGQDFMAWAPEQLQSAFIPYTHVIMNPPFSRQQDIDHIRAAFELLAPGGILLSVAGTSWQWRNNKKTQDFRDWLHENNAIKDVEVIDLPEGAFKESGTMIPTVIIKIRKEGAMESLSTKTTEPEVCASDSKRTDKSINAIAKKLLNSHLSAGTALESSLDLCDDSKTRRASSSRSLMKVNYYDSKAEIRLECYSDTVVIEKEDALNYIAAIRLGG